MKNFIYLILLFSLFIIGCVQKAHKNIDVATWSHDRINKIGEIEFNNTEYIDSCVFIPLETSDESLFGRIQQLGSLDGRYYIFDRQTKKLKVFNSTGSFLYDIGKLGQGPGEYLAISCFVLNKEENKIGIFDPFKNAVLEYTLDGNYLRTVVHNHREFTSISETVCVNNYIYCVTRIDSYGYNTAYMVLSSKDYSIKERFCIYPIKLSKEMAATFMSHPYSIIDGKFHYVSLFSDTIYTYENGKETPYLFVETGKPNIPPDYLKNRNLMIVEDPIQSYIDVWKNNNYSPGFNVLGETNRFIIAKFGVNVSFYLLDKKKKEGFLVENSFLPALGSPSLVEGNKIVRVWNPSDISTYQEMIKNGMIKNGKNEYPKQIESLMKNYDPDNDNPVLVVYYMKDS